MKINLYGYHADQLERMRLAGSYGSIADALRGFISLHGDDFIDRFGTARSPQVPLVRPSTTPLTYPTPTGDIPQSPRSRPTTAPQIKAGEPPEW